MMPALTETSQNPAEAARLALRTLLLERPDFTDTRRHNIRDLIPFLETEDGFPAWLVFYENNLRALSSIWNQVARDVQENPNAEIIEPTLEPAPKAKAETKSRPAEKKAERKTPVASKTVETPPDHQIVLAQETNPAVLEEQAIQAGRALADQFAIVKHHELTLQQAARAIEEATEALAQARQTFNNSNVAYANALEDLARLMASSLGNKAVDFSKLVAKITSGK